MVEEIQPQDVSDKWEPHKLTEVIEHIYAGKKLTQFVNKSFDELNQNLDDESIIRLLSLALDSDKELNKTLSFAEFLLNGSRLSRNRQQGMWFIERVVSGYSILSSIQSELVFQTWIDESHGVTDRLAFFAESLAELNIRDESGKNQKLKSKQLSTIVCIAAIWLYFKNYADFTSLLRYLSRSAFDTKGEAGTHVESNAFAFAAGMITSTKKKKFAWFLKKVSQQEESLSRQIKLGNAEIYHLKNRLKEATAKNAEMLSELKLNEQALEDLREEKIKLKAEIKRQEEKAKHAVIHHDDSKEDLKVKFSKVLGGEVYEIIEKALAANGKSKQDMVEYQLKDALEVINKELQWLGQ